MLKDLKKFLANPIPEKERFWDAKITLEMINQIKTDKVDVFPNTINESYARISGCYVEIAPFLIKGDFKDLLNICELLNLKYNDVLWKGPEYDIAFELPLIFKSLFSKA